MSDLPPSSAEGALPPVPPIPPPPLAKPVVRVAKAGAARPLRRVRPPLPPEPGLKRDTIVALLCGLGVIAFMVVGFFVMNGKQTPSANLLSGVIVEKYSTGEVEKEVSVGQKGLRSQETDSGFYFKVKVASEKDRIFEVPVNEGLYQARKVGDVQSFIRPPSEQK